MDPHNQTQHKTRMKPATFTHGETAITVALETITPDKARAYLGTQTRNRKIRPRNLANLERDMLQGAWTLTAAGISFDAAGALIDGQHRLTAIERSGTTLPLFVFRGFPAAAQDSMDLGSGRTVWEQLGLAGVGNANLITSYSNAIARGILGSSAKLSLAQVKGIAEQLTLMPQATQMDSPKLQFRNAVYLGTITFALHIPRKAKQVALFYDAFTKGIGIADETSPAWRLREYARTAATFGGSAMMETVAYTADCLQAWVEEKPMPTARPTGTGLKWLRAAAPQYTTLRKLLGFQS